MLNVARQCTSGGPVGRAVICAAGVLGSSSGLGGFCLGNRFTKYHAGQRAESIEQAILSVSQTTTMISKNSRTVARISPSSHVASLARRIKSRLRNGKACPMQVDKNERVDTAKAVV